MTKIHFADVTLPLHTASQTDHDIEIGFRRRQGDGPCVARDMSRQICIPEDVSVRQEIDEPILVRVIFYLISVTKL